MPFPIAVAEIAKTETKTSVTVPVGLKSRFAKDNGGEIEVSGGCWQLRFYTGLDEFNQKHTR